MPNGGHPWYDEVTCTAPLTQGDIIEACPVVVLADPVFDTTQGLDGLLQALGASVGVETLRAITMTQACDLAHAHIRNVILCPIYHLEEFRLLWEQAERARGQNPSPRSWDKHTKEIRDGKVWNLAMLRRQEAGPGQTLNMPHQIVDFHEVFSVPVRFLTAWLRASGANRLTLRPPYREHLSQSFARFFMRVGLPQEIGP